MKKILSIALIAALVAVSAFAVDISGEAALGFEYDLDAKSFGFGNTGSMNSVKFKFGEEFFNQSVEKKGEGDVYAVIKASLVIDWTAESKTPLFTSEAATNDPEIDDQDWNKNFGYDGFKGTHTFTKNSKGFTATAEISEAYITNDVWKLNILGSKAASDYAVSAIDSYEDKDDDKKVKYVSAVAFVLDAPLPGFIFEMGGYTASLGLYGNDDYTLFNAFAETAEYDIEGVKAQAAIASYGAISDANSGAFVVGSAKAAYETDTVAINAATDISVLSETDEDVEFNFDVAAKAVGYGVTADAYFALDATDVDSDYPYANENLLSAKVAYKTVIEGVEAGVAFTGLDLINSQDLAASVSAKYGKVSGTVYGGYIVDKETWKAGASAEYTEDLFTVTGSVDAKKKDLKITAGISSETLVAGAKLEAKYASGNLLADEAVYGKITTKATIAF